MSRIVEAINAVYGRFVDGDGAPTIPEPVQSRLEAILWNLAGADVDLPAVETDLEEALGELAEHADESGGGGGSSDITTATVTVDNQSESAVEFYMAVCSDDEPAMMFCVPYTGGGMTAEYKVALYKGLTEIPLDSADGITVAGDAELDAENNVIDISGDCTITISGGGK